jgi:hypothetical protein
LNNRHYIGDIRYGDEWMPGQHQPLVDLELYSQARLNIASRRNARKSKVSVPLNRFLKGLVLCPSCGRRLSVSSKSRRRKSGATILFSDDCCRSTVGGHAPCLAIRFTATLLEDAVILSPSIRARELLEKEQIRKKPTPRIEAGLENSAPRPSTLTKNRRNVVFAQGASWARPRSTSLSWKPIKFVPFAR